MLTTDLWIMFKDVTIGKECRSGSTLLRHCRVLRHVEVCEVTGKIGDCTYL